MRETNSQSPRPWYREPAPWLLALGPATVVVASCFTAWLAVSRPDAVIAADYYKRGLNPTREELAAQPRTAALTAELSLDAAKRKLSLVAFGDVGGVDAAELQFLSPKAARPTRVIHLAAKAPRHFEAQAVELPPGVWMVRTRLGERTLEAQWKIPGAASVALGVAQEENR